MKNTDKVRNAVVMCGGEGTRLRPLTYETPKPLVKVNGVPVIDKVVAELVKNGITDITMAIGYKADMFTSHFGDGKTFGASIKYSIEDKLLGTGGAVRKALAENIVLEDGESVLVANGDNIFDIDLESMYALHKAKGAMATIAVKSIDDVTGYGVVSVESNVIKNFVEKPDPKEAESKLINLGIYLLRGDAVRALPQKEVFSMEREFFAPMSKTGRLCAFVSDQIWYPIDTLERYNKACAEWKPRIL